MSTFPQLEEALEAAARRHYGRRRRRLSWRPMAPTVAVAAAAAAMLIARPDGPPPPVRERPPNVPAATLARSHALTQAPDIPKVKASHPVIPHALVPAVAAEYEARTPYPPGLEDTFDWAATPASPTDMGSTNYRQDVQSLVEYRAGCLWQRFWLSTVSNPPARRAANAVLADIPSWPSIRRNPRVLRKLATAAAAGDAGPLRTNYRLNCRGV